jgi:hypothetical protein
MFGVGTGDAVFVDDGELVAMAALADAFCTAAVDSDAEGCDLLQPGTASSEIRARNGKDTCDFMLRILYWQSGSNQKSLQRCKTTSRFEVSRPTLTSRRCAVLEFKGRNEKAS